VFVAPLEPCDVFFASCGPFQPQTTGHHVPHDGGRAANTPFPNVGGRLDAARAASISNSPQAALGVAVRPNWTVLLLSLNYNLLLYEAITVTLVISKKLLFDKCIFLMHYKVGLGISRTSTGSQWNPVYKAFHQIHRCRNEANGQ